MSEESAEILPFPCVRLEEDDDEFRSCFGDETECQEVDEVRKVQEDDVIDESTVKLYFKGLSVDGVGESECGFTGIGVVLEGSGNFSAIKVQKRLHFYVEDPGADYLALVDGLSEAVKNDIKCVVAMTDSKPLYEQILHDKSTANPLMAALRGRISELASSLEAFCVKLVPSSDIKMPLQLAQVAIGLVSLQDEDNEDGSPVNCSICCEDRLSTMMVSLRCLHNFCSHCLKTYVDVKVQSGQVPVRCPQLNCKYLLSTFDCKSFLPVVSYNAFETAMDEADALSMGKIYCPYPNCSTLLDPCEPFSAISANASSQSDGSCIECPVCHQFICMDCEVPWHTSLSCEEYQNLPLDERDASDVTLHQLAQDRRWRRCQQCRRMIELAQGCYHMTCWCGHEFCYSCGNGYRDGQQSCQCIFWDDANLDDMAVIPACSQEIEQWPWDSFDSFPTVMDPYTDQERSQLALIQRFLAGGFGLSDHQPYQQSPQPHCTDSFVDAMKDLHQLPWLERFVSVISDTYYDDYIH